MILVSWFIDWLRRVFKKSLSWIIELIYGKPQQERKSRAEKRAERYAEKRVRVRAREQMKSKAKKQEFRKFMESIDDETRERMVVQHRCAKLDALRRQAFAYHQGLRICVDLSNAFNNNTRQEINSLAMQVGFMLSRIKKTDVPPCIVLASYEGEIRDALSSAQAVESWMIHRDARPVWELFRECSAPSEGDHPAAQAVPVPRCPDVHELGGEIAEAYGKLFYKKTFQAIADREFSVPEEKGWQRPVRQVVYLSPDAAEPLMTLSDDEVYVIGGFVDRSVKKNLSLDVATEQHLTARRLPIQEAFEDANVGVKALNLNTVVDILVTYAESGSWKQAMETHIPTRRRLQGRVGRKERRKAGEDGSQAEKGVSQGGY